MPANINDFLAHFVTDLNNRYVAALSDLSDEQLACRPNADANHIGFLAWHVLRTEDNVINYLCQGRKTTVWLQQALNVRWGLPKAAQGTGMDPREAYAPARARRGRTRAVRQRPDGERAAVPGDRRRAGAARLDSAWGRTGGNP